MTGIIVLGGCWMVAEVGFMTYVYFCGNPFQ